LPSFSTLNGTSQMMQRSAPLRYELISEVSPLFRPNSSMTAMRSWLPVLVRSWWMNSTVRVMAVLKPRQ